MKKIKITKEQYNIIAKHLTENVNLKPIPDMGKKVNKEFKKAFVNNKSMLKEFGNDVNESQDNLKHETLELIKYLYRKTEDFSPFWAEHDLTYDDICDALESKGIVIKKDGKFELSKSLGSAEKAKKAVEDELRNMVGGEITEIEEGQNVKGGYKCLAVNNQETLAILEKNGEYFLFEFSDVKDDILEDIEAPIIGGRRHREYAGRNSDGEAEYDDDVEYDYGDKEITSQDIENYLENEDSIIWTDDDWNSLIIPLTIEMIKRLVSLKTSPYTSRFSDPFTFTLKDMLKTNGEVNEMDDIETKQKLGEPFRQQPSGYEDKSPEEKERIRQSLAAIKARSQAQDIERFKQRDLQNAIDSANAEEKLKTIEPEIPELPLKPKGQYNIFGGVDEMALGGAGAMGGVAAPNTAANSGQYTTALKLKESMEASPNTTGEYTAPAFKMKKNHTDFAETNPKAFQKTQWAGGSFVEFDDCTKLNNNTKAQKGGCSAGAVDGVVKQRKSKGNINAPSLNEVYKVVAEKTGRTIDEVKAIIESKKNKG